MKNRHSKLSYKSELLYRGTKNSLNFSGWGESNEVQKILAIVLTALCLFAAVGTVAYAETVSNPDYGVSPAYEYADIASSRLSISGQTAYCTSETEGDAVSITVEQTLEKHSGWFWIWNSVDGANWTKTVNLNSISMSNTKSGLSSGTYRLKSVFTLTSSSGKTETITVYSEEKTI